MNREVIEKLQILNTRQVLRILRGTYKMSWGCPVACSSCDGLELWKQEDHVDEIKAVLATREHIPNKDEARKIRQQSAKTRKEARNNRLVRR